MIPLDTAAPQRESPRRSRIPGAVMKFLPGNVPHNKRQPPPEPVSVEPSPEERLAEAQAAVNALRAEATEIEAELAEHARQRHQWLSEGGDLDHVAELARQDERLRLRIEQIGHRLPPLQAAVHAAWRVVQESAWQDRRPALQQAEQQLAAAIRALYAAIDTAHELHNAAHRGGFGSRLSEFVRPPAPLVADFALRQYVATIEQRERPQPALEIVIEVPPDASLEDALSRAPRFVPQRVPRSLIEQVSPLERRTVRVLHTFSAAKSDLNIGHALLRAGTEMTVGAKAAFVMTYAGVAEYVDEPVTVPAAWKEHAMVQYLDHAAWVAATGSHVAGRSLRRPVNPKLAQLVVLPAKSARSVALARQMRRLRLDVAEATAPIDPPRRRTQPARGVAQWELNQPGKAGRAAYERHAAVLQCWHGMR